MSCKQVQKPKPVYQIVSPSTNTIYYTYEINRYVPQCIIFWNAQGERIRLCGTFEEKEVKGMP